MHQERILVVDDEKMINWALVEMLEDAGYLVASAFTGGEAREKFRLFNPGMVLLDISLPDANGMDLLQEFKEEDENLLVIMITANADLDSTVKSLKRGADEYIGKPFNLDVVEHRVAQIFEKKKLRRQTDSAKRILRRHSDFDQLIGSSEKMIDVFKMTKVCAESDCKTILILGESGTGKELVARAIHNHSGRNDAPFVDVNCAAIPDNLLENELFGHEKGAFTDATQREQGIFECAEGGTVFLDEIGDMPLIMQTKILKIIETRRYRRVGGRESLNVNVRIVAATNQDLLKLVEDGLFRGDLYYRLNVMCINLPPLRERIDCIQSLVDYFISRLNSEYGKRCSGIDSETMACLKEYSWPGNVRELRNTIERMMMLDNSSVLTKQFLPPEIKNPAEHADKGLLSSNTDSHNGEAQLDINLPREGITLEEVEKVLIQQALERYNGNQTKAANCLGMSRDTMRYRMKKFDLN
ncbi:MAG: sigma-54 dependent transcriptional regulator [Desulfuromonas sp.]|nr:sigma-54 dependent transcriptional regulator [Desulfuromonas sp.]